MRQRGTFPQAIPVRLHEYFRQHVQRVGGHEPRVISQQLDQTRPRHENSPRLVDASRHTRRAVGQRFYYRHERSD